MHAEPSTASAEFLRQVEAAQGRLAALGTASDAALTSWVRDQWPTPTLTHPAGVPPFAEGGSGEFTSYVLLDHSRVLHNRVDLEPARVADLVRLLLTSDEPELLAAAKVTGTEDPTWQSSLRQGQVPAEDARWTARWLVLEGNHRLLAQVVCGVGPFAKVERPSPRWYWVGSVLPPRLEC